MGSGEIGSGRFSVAHLQNSLFFPLKFAVERSPGAITRENKRQVKLPICEIIVSHEITRETIINAFSTVITPPSLQSAVEPGKVKKERCELSALLFVIFLVTK